ncbi:MAG: NAD(P)H-quinone oxidoreductase subunit F [Pseudanabaena sp.]|jgi:NAD(P)H-quinone oxidoreductase subunit 5|nr:NAD(P)H-quinone oxidoreductase subunit F [Pseudanabaena sp. M135S2SP2A07QC]MCA6586447.1 NAD(P)H-quinone oxidoreductase subunit F [Pseudanabaena sp. M051S1SP1A06QC]MCA6589647.1 NAD(P)H-quinone oxidoreductase subunit F [Pseudanabaena sp. M109S1SP1A06QC]MCA6605094.1 NAD(P)H-quinone oxidoreductase subunit F [Pseudanabaena sp. M007S1SP1A06QC]MCA6612135.1 NAD(P)H-quinone oxidoreductase subunit F [Pseudanabaena sp. M158S2SP1A06QC]MCA6615999.1 NAD(P)H-quinone oxidoreductase subunit F [Pseudanabaena
MINNWLDSIWLIPCYSLIGAMLSIIWFPAITRKTGPRPAGYVNILMTFFSFLHAIAALTVAWGKPAYSLSFPWLAVGGLNFTIDLQISDLNIGAIVLVAGINLLAQIYAVGYMEMDWGWGRFFALLALFEAGMCSLVLCNSLFFSYVILEILTLGTYLLVGIWYNQSLVVTGARDAFLTKRVGDLFLLMGVVGLFPLTGTWNFTELAEWAKTTDINPMTISLVTLALIVGPMGKCAQFPLHLWLDEAMEGPLPSTILRNSVVVATGAWILVKLQPLIAISPLTQQVVIAIGAATAFGTVLISIAQIDIKRSLSYLTSAFMGLIFIAVGVNDIHSAYTLILSHALAIALLFMAIGSIISNVITQDLTLNGGLWNRRPVSGLCFLVGTLGLIAFPPFGGFWAMLDLISELWHKNIALAELLLLINGLIAFSLMRVFGLIWGGKPKQMTERSVEPLWLMVLPMTFLAGIVLHTPQMLTAWGIIPDLAIILKPESLLLLGSSSMGLAAGAYLYLNEKVSKPIQLPWQDLQQFFAYDFYTSKLYKVTIVGLVESVSHAMYWFDRFFVDGVGNLFGLATLFSGQNLRYSTFGQLQLYTLTIMVGIGVLLLLLFNQTL